MDCFNNYPSHSVPCHSSCLVFPLFTECPHNFRSFSSSLSSFAVAETPSVYADYSVKGSFVARLTGKQQNPGGCNLQAVSNLTLYPRDHPSGYLSTHSKPACYSRAGLDRLP